MYETKWVKKIKQILDNTGSSYLWNFDGITSVKLKSTIKQKLRDAFLQNWQRDIIENNLCTNYRIMKIDFGQESYLKALPNNIRIILTKFRSSSHNLPISDKRYNPIDDRNICPLCNSDIGDEFHYVLICSAFNHIRSSYIHERFISRPNTMKFYQLFSSPNPSVLIKLSKFLKIIMHIFR